ncbi:MAG TPA: TIGR01777 family oxidoreductase [Cellvibrionaceae bacterium]
MSNHALKGKNLLLTGGSGFIGQALCPRLLELGAELTVLTRKPERTAALLGPRVQCVAELNQLPAAGFFGVVNLAGAPIMSGRWTASRKALLHTSRVELTRHLYEALKQQAAFPEVVVSSSAIGYYGDTGEQEATEASSSGEGFAASLCRDWEQAAGDFARQGARLCLLRTGIVLGPDGGALARMRLPFLLGLGGPMGSGSQIMSWIHRDDLVEMIIWLLSDQAISGAINGTAPNPVTNRVFSQTLGRVLSRPALLPMPAFMVKLLFGQAGEELLLASNHVVPAKAVENHFAFRHPELHEALQASLKNN